MASLANGAQKRKMEDSDDDSDRDSEWSDDSDSSAEEEEEEEETYTVPNPLELKIGAEGVADINFHPSRDLLSLISTGGRVRLYDLHGREDGLRVDACGGRWHKGGRAVRFSPDGQRLFSASVQGGVKGHDVETGGRVFCRLQAHGEPVTALLAVDEHKLVTGSEAGEVKLFDTRAPDGCAFRLHCRDDEESGPEDAMFDPGVNSLAVDAEGRQLLAAGDDGCLRAISLRGRRRLLCRSEPLGYSARGVCLVKDGKKAVVGSEEGVLSLFNFGEWGNISDRFPVMGGAGGADSRVIEAMARVSEEVVVVGGEDGRLRAVRLLPNRVLGAVGRHGAGGGDEALCDGLSLASSASGLFLASACLESRRVQFWPAQHLAPVGAEEAENLRRGRKRKKREELPLGRRMAAADPRKAFLSDIT